MAVRGDFKSPGDLEVINPKKPGSHERLTHINDGLLNNLQLAGEEEVNFDSSQGGKIQGWVVKPPNFNAAEKYPLILEIHGGPHGMYSTAFNPMFQNFAANGYVTLYINPRGSTGYGSAFGNAIEKHYPGLDYDDLMAGVDTLLKSGYVDQSRLYISGCSGGGVLSSWTIGHTTRFAAAAVRCPVIDWLSMAGETDVPYFTYRFFNKKPWEDPTDWLAQSSLMYVGHIKNAGAAHDRRARPPHADAADGGVLHGVKDPRRARRVAALRWRIPRHRAQAVQLDADPAVYDELVR